jgi:hypothetical protein
MILYTGHGGSGSALNFTPGNISGTRVEMKVCELCGCPYVRPVNPEARTGRDCGRCIAAAERRRAKEARELTTAREQGDPRKMMPAQ